MKNLLDWELWACAQQQIGQNGAAASVMAAIQADKLLDDGDLDGQRVWLGILHRIEQLQAPRGNDALN